MNQQKKNILIYGAGAIGATLGGLITPYYEQIYLKVRGDNYKALREHGLTLYLWQSSKKEKIRAKVIENLDELPFPKYIILSVKNYDLEEAAKDIQSHYGDASIIVAMQNGVQNQEILPKYFTKIIYTVIFFSAWQDVPGVFGHKEKGQLILGTKNQSLSRQLNEIAGILNFAFPTSITERLQDAVHSKLVLNLGNALFTLADIDNLTPEAITKLRKISINTLLEGISIVRIAGFKQYKLVGVPSWKIFKLATKAPKRIVDKVFLRTLEETKQNSMIQDMMFRQKGQSELESLSGYILKLANAHNLKAPYNSTLYELCKEQFQKKPYIRLNIDTIWEAIQNKIR